MRPKKYSNFHKAVKCSSTREADASVYVVMKALARRLFSIKRRRLAICWPHVPSATRCLIKGQDCGPSSFCHPLRRNLNSLGPSVSQLSAAAAILVSSMGRQSRNLSPKCQWIDKIVILLTWPTNYSPDDPDSVAGS